MKERVEKTGENRVRDGRESREGGWRGEDGENRVREGRESREGKGRGEDRGE